MQGLNFFLDKKDVVNYLICTSVNNLECSSVSLKPQTPKGSANEATRNNSLGGRLGSVDELLNNIGKGYKRAKI